MKRVLRLFNLYSATIFVLLFCFSLKAQNSTFQFYNTSSGISQHSATSIVQDHQGFLWVGTRYGLLRYDGLKFQPYLHTNGDSSALSNSTVNCLLVDKSGNIWAGTNGGGLNYYNYKEDRFLAYQNERNNPRSLVENHINAIFQDNEGHIWVGTEQGGLDMFDSATRCFTHYKFNPEDPHSISSNNIATIAEDARGNLWVGTWHDGLNLFDRKSKTFTRFNAGNSDLPHNTVRYLYLSGKGEFFVGTANGPRKLAYQNGKPHFPTVLPEDNPLTKQMSNKRVLSMVIDHKNHLWVGTENDGLFMVNLDNGTGHQFLNDPNDPTSLSSNSIWSLFTDNVGTLWIGTFNQGLCKLDAFERKFPHLYRSDFSPNSLSNNVVSAFSEDDKGNIWVGTEGGGLNYFDRKTEIFKHYLPEEGNPRSLSNSTVVSLMTDCKGNLWVGTWKGGVCIKPRGKDYFIRMMHNPRNSNSLANNDIYKLMEDSKGRIWISTFRAGLDVYDPATKEFTHYSYQPDGDPKHFISSNKVRYILEDHQHNIWLGMEGAGVDRIRINDKMEITGHENFSAENEGPNTLSNNNIVCLFEDSNGVIWVGTEGGGLNQYHDDIKGFTNISRKDGLAGEVIYSMEETDKGVLWLSTNNGLVEYNTANGSLRNYDQTDGLQSSEFYKSASLKTHDGYLLFGGIQGFNLFYPDSIRTNPNRPKVYITGFYISNTKVRTGGGSPLKENIVEAKNMELSYDQNDFQFQLSALNFSQSKKNHYAYMLENFDQGWKYTDDPSSVYYTNVPPGHYTFKVKGSNNDGVWSKSDRKLALTIMPPWYRSNIAYFTYLVLIVIALILARKNIIRNERLKSQLQMEHMQLEQMKELSQVRSRFFTNISHEFRTPLTLIISPLRGLLNQSHDSSIQKPMKLMLKNAQRLLNLINQILDLSKLESGHMKLHASEHDIVKFTKLIAFSFSSYSDKRIINYKTIFPKEKIPVYFEKDKMEKVLVNLLSNAFKFTPEFGEVLVSVEASEKEAIITVKDTGKGIPQGEIDHIFNRFYQAENGDAGLGTGIGLALTKELVELHKGEITVQSDPDKGSVFKVKLPLGDQHLLTSEINEGEDKWEFKVDSGAESDLLREELPTPVEKSNPDKEVVLVVEDNPEIRTFIKGCLHAEYKLLEAENGKQGLELASEQIPDIIISDIMMPEMDGYELCNALKKGEKTSHIPIILLTAKASVDSEEQGFEFGANYYITKPFNPRLLLLRIRNILQNRKTYKSLLLQNKAINLEPGPVLISDADEIFIKKVMQCVEENMGNSDFQVADLSTTLGMSKMQLYRKMKGLIGCSANEFIRTIRLKKAAQLLKHDDLTIAEITYEVGFNDLQYFRSCFKKQYGINPSEYSKNATEQSA